MIGSNGARTDNADKVSAAGGSMPEESHAMSARLMDRRTWIGAAAASVALLVLKDQAWSSQQQPATNVTVYKDPNCGCCNKWVEYMRKAGFKVDTRDLSDVTPVKRQHGVAEKLYSCHTAVVGGYVFEGHVPADLVQKVLREKPSFAGLAAPGMPQSAPGMDIGHEKYEILSFTRNGETKVYAVRS